MTRPSAPEPPDSACHHSRRTVAAQRRLDARAAFAALPEGVRTATWAHLDRLLTDATWVFARTMVERKGARIVSAAGEGTEDDGPTGRLMRQIVDAFAEYERALIRSRTRAALQAKRSRGERAGHTLRISNRG